MPRTYETANIDKLEIVINEVNVDVVKVLSNKKSAISVEKYSVDFQSDVGQIYVSGDLKKNIVTLDDINLTKIDTLALKAMFVPDTNESNVTEEKPVVASVDENRSKTEKPNNLIPEKVVLKSFHTDILPSTYEPVKIEDIALNIKDVIFDIPKLMVEKGKIDLKGKTNLSNFSHESSIKNNTLSGDLIVSPNEELFTLYKLPVSREAIGDIKIDFNASEEKVVAHLNAKAKQLLVVAVDVNSTDSNATDVNKTKPFNVDIDDLSSEVVFIVKSKALNADTKIMITTPYAKDISVTNKFVMDGNMSYDGAINVAKVMSPEGKQITPSK